MRIVYVNGTFVPEDSASISIFDRGFLFGDAVYEVTSVFDGKLVDYVGHAERLKRSLNELGIVMPVDDDELLSIYRELVKRNNLNEGLVYLEISRGAADRDFLFPGNNVKPTLVLFTQKKSLIDNPVSARGQKVITVEDLRWQRGDIKTVQLLYACLVKNQAKALGADDAWLVRDGLVTEGASNNAYIVTPDGHIVTRQLSNDILGGITRNAILQCASDLQLKVEERPFSVEEAQAATEAFSTSASGLVSPVIEIDKTKVGSGGVGPVTSRLRAIYIEHSRATAI